jgi:hypothetical protein
MDTWMTDITMRDYASLLSFIHTILVATKVSGLASMEDRGRFVGKLVFRGRRSGRF